MLYLVNLPDVCSLRDGILSSNWLQCTTSPSGKDKKNPRVFRVLLGNNDRFNRSFVKTLSFQKAFGKYFRMTFAMTCHCASFGPPGQRSAADQNGLPPQNFLAGDKASKCQGFKKKSSQPLDFFSVSSQALKVVVRCNVSTPSPCPGSMESKLEVCTCHHESNSKMSSVNQVGIFAIIA